MRRASFETGGRFKHLTGTLRILSTGAECMQSEAKKAVCANPVSGHRSARSSRSGITVLAISRTHDHISVEPGPLTISHLTKSVIQTFSPKKQGSNCALIYTSKSTGAEIKPASRYSEIGRIQTAPWGIETVLCLTFCASVMKNVPFLSSSVHSVKRGQFWGRRLTEFFS